METDTRQQRLHLAQTWRKVHLNTWTCILPIACDWFNNVTITSNVLKCFYKENTVTKTDEFSKTTQTMPVLRVSQPLIQDSIQLYLLFKSMLKETSIPLQTSCDWTFLCQLEFESHMFCCLGLCTNITYLYIANKLWFNYVWACSQKLTLFN